jgi:hypothetical protein
MLSVSVSPKAVTTDHFINIFIILKYLFSFLILDGDFEVPEKRLGGGSYSGKGIVFFCRHCHFRTSATSVLKNHLESEHLIEEEDRIEEKVQVVGGGGPRGGAGGVLKYSMSFMFRLNI